MSGNINTRTEVIPASGNVQLPNANFIFVLTSSGPVTIDLNRVGLAKGANRETYAGVQAGLQIARTQRWDTCSLTGAAGVSVTFMYGYTSIRDDATLFNAQIAVISGVTTTAENPSSLFVDTIDTALASGANSAIVANLLRRRITIGVPSSGGNSVRVSFAGGAGRGIEIQPGQFAEFQTTAALNVRNDNTNGSGAATSWYAEEET